MMNQLRGLCFVLMVILLAAGTQAVAQPWHTQVLYHDFLDNPNSQALGTMQNNGGVFVPGKGWETISPSSKLFITLPALLPLEGSLEVDVTHFDPWFQNDATENLKQHCINIWSRPEADKSVFETNAAWINVRTQRHSKYSAGDGLIGFKLLTQPRGSDSRWEDYVMRDMDWNYHATYTFRVVWTAEKAYIYVNNRLRATFPYSGQIEPFRYIFLGKDNLIYGYCTMVGPIYSNLTVYGADGSVPPPPPPPVDPPPPPPASKNLFANITTSAAAAGYSASGYGQGVSFADVNDDGLIDFFVSNGTSYSPTPDHLYVNKGNRTFSDQAGLRGTTNTGLTKAIVSADFNADGFLDAFFANVPLSAGDPAGINTLYINDGEGHFADSTLSSGIARVPRTSNGSIAFDADGDGDLDLYVVNPGDLNELYLNDGAGRFTLVHSGAEGEVENTAVFGRQGVTAADIDNDGDIDLYVCRRQESSSAAPNWLFINDGHGRFTEEAAARRADIGGRSHGATFADIDNDGDLDLFVVNYTLPEGDLPRLTLLINDGSGHFSDRSSDLNINVSGYSVLCGDVDNDGDLDLLVLRNAEKEPGAKPQLYLNDGTGRFTLLVDAGVEVAAGDFRGGAFADIDNDGDLDAYLTSAKSQNYLLRNDLQSGNHHLKVLCMGPKGDYGGIGSKVTLYEAGRYGDPAAILGHQEVVSQFGYMSQGPVMLHFGLGTRTRCDLRVVFSNGDSLKATGVDAGQTFVARCEQRRLQLNKWSGDGQVPSPGQIFPLPFAVMVVDQNGAPAAQVPVLFSVKSGNGSLSGETSRPVNTGPDGVAAVQWQAGPWWGPEQSLEARVLQGGQDVPGSPVVWTFAAPVVDPLHSTVTATSPVWADGARVSQITVTLNAAAGVSAGPGFTVKLHVLGGAHHLAQADTLTNGLGQVTATLSATTPGERKIVAVVRGLEITLADTTVVQFNAVPQTADSLLYVDGNNQTAAAGEWLARPLQVRVVNELGLALRGYPVHFRVVAGGGRFSNGLDSVTIASDTLGVAQVLLRLGGVAGIANQNVQVWAEHAQNAPLLFSANATSAAAASLVKVSGDSQKVMPGAVVPLPLRVRLLDRFGNFVPFSPLTFIAPQGGVLLDPQPCISDSNGYAETRIGAPAVSGTHTYQAVLGSGSTAVFALEVLKANQKPQILAYNPAEPYILGYYDQTLQFRLTSVRDADGDSLHFRWLVNGQEKSTTADLSFIPRFIDGKDYEVVAWLKDGVDSVSVRWQVAVTLTGLCESRGQLPATLQLRQNYPNPFNPTTQMRLEVPAAKQISLRIYNVQGQLVRTLCDAVLAPGYHTMIWDARNEAGQTVPSGIYHAVLLAEDQRQIIRLLLMK